MIINYLLEKIQNFVAPLVKHSLVLRLLDKFIFLSICLTLFTSTFAPSDTIGYFALIGIFLTFIKLLTKKGQRLEPNRFELCLIIYLGFVIISVAGSSLFYLSLKGFLKTLIYLGYYVCCVVYLRDYKKDILKFFGLIALCIGYESVIGLLQNSTHVSALAGWQDTANLNPEQIMTRVFGTLKPLNPNLFGGYLLSVLPVAYGLSALLLYKKHNASALAGLSLSLLATLVMVMSGCRGVYIAFPLMVLIPAIVLIKRVSPNIKSLLYKIYASVFVLASGLVLASTSLRARILSIFTLRNDSSTSFRLNVYQSSIKMFQDNPFLGIGVGNQNFRETYGLYMKTGYDALSAYNIYLETAVESGIFALLSFVGFLVFLFIEAFKTMFCSKNIEKVIITTIAITSITGILAHGMVDTVFFRPQLQFIFWLMVAVIKVRNHVKSEK